MKQVVDTERAPNLLRKLGNVEIPAEELSKIAASKACKPALGAIFGRANKRAREPFRRESVRTSCEKYYFWIWKSRLA